MAVREPQAAIDARTGAALPEVGVAAGEAVRQSSLWQDAWRRYVRNKGAVAAAAVFIIIVLYAFLIPGFWIIPGIWTDGVGNVDPYDVDFSAANENPSAAHPFGTDQFGRDLFARAALGGQVSIEIGFAATVVILVVAIIYGGISGFVGGSLDNIMMRFLDALYGLPFLPFAIITLAIVGTVNILTMVIALSIVSWFTDARVVRGQIITLKQNDYVRAAHAVGARWYRILARHLIPNTLGILIISMFLSLPGVVLPDAPGHDLGAEPLHRRDRPLRELHRGRPPRRARPANAGDVAGWPFSRSTTSRRTSSCGRVSSAPSTVSRSSWRRDRPSASSASPAAGSP
jgi:oligopeptide transport system permease protein